MKKYNVLIPAYMKDFKCIGGECEDSCCVGWRVSIDKNTFKNYKKVNNKEFRDKLNKYVKRNRHSINENDYANIKLLEDKSCPFLNDKKLCEVFINVGEQNLSKVCTTYPRIYNKVDDVFEKSLTLSCPIAAKLVLLNKDLMEFNQSESNEVLGIIKKEVNTKNNKEYNRYFWELRVFTIDLLQNREYSIEDRLIILGMFCNEINSNGDIIRIIEKFRNRILNNTYKEFLHEITDELNVKLNVLKQIIDVKVDNLNNGVYLDFYNKSMEGLGCSNKNIDMTLSYNLCYENYYKDFMTNREYIIENFLVNYAFQNTFPLGDKKIFDEYIMISVYYSLIKIHLIGLSGYYKEKFSENIIIKFIQKFSKLILHDQMYINWIFSIIKENKLDSMAYMAIFLKH